MERDKLRLTLYALRFTLHTLHSTFYTLHFTLHILHHSTLYPFHSTLYTRHFALHNPHFPPYTLDSPLNTPLSSHSTLCTPLHSTLHSLHWNASSRRMYKTVEITCFTKVFYATASLCVSTSVPLTYVWAFGFASVDFPTAGRRTILGLVIESLGLRVASASPIISMLLRPTSLTPVVKSPLETFHGSSQPWHCIDCQCWTLQALNKRPPFICSMHGV